MKAHKIKVIDKKELTLENILSELLNIEKYVDMILKYIKYAIENDLVKINIFKVKYKDSNYDLVFHRNNWDNVLNIILDYFIKYEKYEKCILVKKLLDYE